MGSTASIFVHTTRNGRTLLAGGEVQAVKARFLADVVKVEVFMQDVSGRLPRSLVPLRER